MNTNDSYKDMTIEGNSTIHRVFEQQVEQCPTATAILYLGEPLSYRQLNLRANGLAQHMQCHGVIKGDIVALAMTPCIEQTIALLATLKCGASYLPIDDITNPDSRSQMFIEDAQVKVLLTNHHEHHLYEEGLDVISVSNKAAFDAEIEDFQSVDVDEDHPAYIMFTSGSTGKPKGVVVPHRAVVRLVKNSNYITITEQDRLLQFAPPSFDASTFEFWGALLNGATLIPYSGTVLDPKILRKDIFDYQVSVCWLTAALFHLIADKFVEVLTPLRVLLAGGDILNPKYVNKVLGLSKDITIINGYGPTENTTFTCCHVMTWKNPPKSSVMIGKAITGTVLHILDDDLKPVAESEVGQLFVSGKGVALGYLQDDYNASFFKDEKIAPGLIYRTGDLVKQNSKGELDFIGRKDNQIKIRGYRISLEEVKSSLLGLSDVNDAMVVRKAFGPSDQILAAYVQVKCTKALSEKKNFHRYVRSIKQQLETTLPSYMIPEQFIFNTDIPITSNGKIDKKKILNTINNQNVEHEND